MQVVTQRHAYADGQLITLIALVVVVRVASRRSFTPCSSVVSSRNETRETDANEATREEARRRYDAASDTFDAHTLRACFSPPPACRQ